MNNQKIIFVILLFFALPSWAQSVSCSTAASTDYVPSYGEFEVGQDANSRYVINFMWWEGNSRLSWLWSRADTTFELDTFFYNYDGTAYGEEPVGFWESDLPVPYVDTQQFDSDDEKAVTIGSAYAFDILPDRYYYYATRMTSGGGNSSWTKISAQRGRRVPGWCNSTHCSFGCEQQSNNEKMVNFTEFTAPGCKRAWWDWPGYPGRYVDNCPTPPPPPPSCNGVGYGSCSYSPAANCNAAGNRNYTISWWAQNATFYDAFRQNTHFYSGSALSRTILMYPGNPEYIDVYASNSCSTLNPVCHMYVDPEPCDTGGGCYNSNPSSSVLTLDGGSRQVDHNCPYTLDRLKTVPEDSNPILMEEWAVLASVDTTLSGVAAISASDVDYGAYRAACLLGGLPPEEIQDLVSDVFLLVDHVPHVMNDRFMPHPDVSYSQTAPLSDPANLDGFFRVEYDPTGQVDNARILYATEDQPRELLEALVNGVSVGYTDERRHRLVLFGNFSVVDGEITMPAYEVTTPQCCTGGPGDCGPGTGRYCP